MQAHQTQREKRRKVVKDVDDEYSDIEWDDVVVVVEREAVKQVVVVVDTRWEETKRVRRRPNQVKKIIRLIRGVNIEEETVRLVKGNITGNPNVMSNQIPTAISLMLRIVTKKNTLHRLC
jgi:hypothetical protein